jgi:parvulin-like peptidyl-prolyl isomerase
MRIWREGQAVLAAAVLAAGCGREEIAPATRGAKHGPKDVAAKVNGHKLLWSDVERRARSFYLDETGSKKLAIPAGREEDAMEFFRRKAVNVFVFKTIMLDEARRQSLKVTEDDRKACMQRLELELRRHDKTLDDFFKKQTCYTEAEMRAEFEDGLMVDRLVDVLVKEKIQVSDSDVDALASEVAKVRGEQHRKAEELRRQLVAGADFAALASAHSAHVASKAQGGDLGEFARGRMGPEIDAVVFKQRLNEIGPVVETRLGYVILKVTAHTSAKAATATTPEVPETVRASQILLRAPPVLSGRDLQDEIRRRKYVKGVETLYGALKAKAKIECAYKEMVF